MNVLSAGLWTDPIILKITNLPCCGGGVPVVVLPHNIVSQLNFLKFIHPQVEV